MYSCDALGQSSSIVKCPPVTIISKPRSATHVPGASNQIVLLQYGELSEDSSVGVTVNRVQVDTIRCTCTSRAAIPFF